VARVESALSAGHDVVADFEDFVSSIAVPDGEFTSNTEIRTGG
jgi:hypothetical protein